MSNFKINEDYLEDWNLKEVKEIEGRVIVIKKSWFNNEYKEEDISHIAIATGGFGCSSYTHGSAIYVKFLEDDQETRIERSDVYKLVKTEYENIIREEIEEEKEATK